jgi:hypothetical protein
LSPKATGNDERVNFTLFPPLPFLACGVNMVVMDGAEWNRELVAYLQTEPTGLRVADVVSV